MANKEYYIDNGETDNFYIRENRIVGTEIPAIIPEDKVKWLEKVEKEYNEAQEYLYDLHQKAEEERERKRIENDPRRCGECLHHSDCYDGEDRGKDDRIGDCNRYVRKYVKKKAKR